MTLIDKLEQRKQDFEPRFASDFWILEGLDKAINIVKEHSEWISVNERLPEPNKLVLVAIHRPQYYVPDFMYITTADYDEVRKKWSSINVVDDLHNVVYWQPFPNLPSPPSEV